MDEWLRTGADGVVRCWWPGTDETYVRYHDTEWGRPVVDDVRLFEKLVLEGFQSGLSWLTILRKRENFRAAFAGFDMEAVARFGDADIARLLGDAGIVRHRGKIVSAINNAQRSCELVDEHGSLAAYVWAQEPTERELDGVTPDGPGIPSKTPTSTRISKDLKRRGWSFVGPTTVYAFMQAMGLVNDHLDGCATREQCAAARAATTVPAARNRQP
jgi:DNA-3-methyladenine glycosylase I